MKKFFTFHILLLGILTAQELPFGTPKYFEMEIETNILQIDVQVPSSLPRDIISSIEPYESYNKDIYFIEALKDYVKINTLDKRYIIHSTMKSINEKLPVLEFARVHRSFIVRLDKITAIEFPNIILEHENKYIPIGNSFRDELMNKLKLV